ncbi:hypothetical protein D9758_002071 [Tetrapyrgos nigripes]|uniref:Dynactin subunit 2 n=1 Tax=Tetrapyrgos nigripes TaxID=182062 RepID=A0A8H5GTP4_9AGAR|nr:hypothetical protein D9758_002071 [Tetrapyrgos nigripes]
MSDTAQDIYETEDVVQSSQVQGDSSDEELPSSNRPSAFRGKNGESAVNKEELDGSNLIAADEASKRFRKAERRRGKPRTQYAYPPSPAPSSSSAEEPSHPVLLSHRIRKLQAEMTALEQELADPSNNPLLQQEKEHDNFDFGEMLRGMTDVKARLDKIKKEKEGRGKLVGVILGEKMTAKDEDKGAKPTEARDTTTQPDFQNVAEMDRRLGELEKLVGSSTSILDEQTSPLPPPLLTQITRVNNQLSVLAQPRHIDSISRRLKILISELDRASNQRRQSGGGQVDPQIAVLLHRVGPLLPQIPHILTRLRTLSTLHASAGEFQSTLERVEGEEEKTKEELEELERAVETLEKSLVENRQVMKGNVEGLETRLNELFKRLESIK